MRVLALVALMTTAAEANPPPPVPENDVEPTLLLGGGMRLASGYAETLEGYPSKASSSAGGAALELVVGVHMSPSISIGVRAGLSRHENRDSYAYLHDDGYDVDRSIVPLDVGLAVQYAQGPFAVTPWAGRHLTRFRNDSVTCPERSMTCTEVHTLDWSSDFFSFGATASVDLTRTGSNRLAAFLALQGHIGDSSLENGGMPSTYSSVTFGLAYRRP